MAGRNRNTFLKRQKEIERVRRAAEKTARRQGKRARAAEAVAEGQPPVTIPADAGLAEGTGTRNQEARVNEEELVHSHD